MNQIELNPAMFRITGGTPVPFRCPFGRAVLRTLRELGSTRAELFLSLTTSPDKAVRDEAIAVPRGGAGKAAAAVAAVECVAAAERTGAIDDDETAARGRS